MYKRVLAWEGNVNTDTCTDEDIAVVMEASKGIFKAVEVLSRYNITSNNVTKVQKC